MMRVAEGQKDIKCLKQLRGKIKDAVIFNSCSTGTASPGAFGNVEDVFSCPKAGRGECFGI